MTSLSDFLAAIRHRKREAGHDDSPAATEAMRNKGEGRTPAKRELLRRAEARARASGRAPVKGYF